MFKTIDNKQVECLRFLRRSKGYVRTHGVHEPSMLTSVQCVHSVCSAWRVHLKQLKAVLAAATDPEQTEAESGAAELLWREACSVGSVE